MSSEHIIFVTVPYSRIALQNEALAHEVSDVGINILLDSADIDIAIILDFVKKSGHNFIVSISDAVLNRDNIHSKLYLLLTMTDQVAGCKKLIPFFTDNAENFQGGVSAFNNYLRQQGETDIGFAIFETPQTQINNEVLLAESDWLESFSRDTSDKFGSSDISRIFLHPDDMRSLKEQIAYVQKLVTGSQHIKTFLSVIELRKRNNQLQYETYLWEKRAGLYLSFIALGKRVGETEYYDIRKWYHDEYETLPLWYKRVGHVLKVLKGKRSFKSLFSDKAKK